MLNMVLDIEISLLHDILVAPDIVNVDYEQQIRECASSSSPSTLVCAIGAVRELQNTIAYNVSAESIVDLALFEFKGAV